MTDQDEEDALRFRIGMRVAHPTLDLAPVLAPLGIIPTHSKVAGAPRVGVKGQSLPGTYRFSSWNWSRQIKGTGTSPPRRSAWRRRSRRTGSCFKRSRNRAAALRSAWR